MPLVSVIMPVYNAEAYLNDSVRSILAQSLTNFEFLIFNDGSTDNSLSILQAYAASDKRIKLINKNANGGYVPLLNEGIEMAVGKYIARMDADDVSLPSRFEKQVTFLEQNPEYILCGSLYTQMNGAMPVALSAEDDELKLKLLYMTPFCHPTVMMRRELLMNHQLRYDASLMPAEDDDFWIKLSCFGKFHNIQQSLLNYRIHGNNISFQRRTEEQFEASRVSKLNYLRYFFSNLNLEEEQLILLYRLLCVEQPVDYETLVLMGKLVDLISASSAHYPIESRMVKDLLHQKLFYRCTTSTYIGIKSFLLAQQHCKKIQLYPKGKLLIKSLLRMGRTI